jgi:hypothetical protein
MQREIRRGRQRRIPNRGPNRNVHNTSNYDTKPHSVYFYYLTRAANGSLVATPGFFDNGNAELTYRELKERAALLVADARNGEIEPPPDDCDGPARCWTRRSWLLYVLDDPGLQFRHHPIEVWPAPPNRAYNHAFFDGREFPVTVGPDRLSATACINHLYANEHRDDLEVPGDYQDFDLRVYYEPVTGRPLTDDPLYFDSGGTNMGPPVPPPVVAIG